VSPGLRVWLPEAITTTAPAIDRIFYIVLWITGITFVLVQATLLIFLVRYRRRPGRPASYIHGHPIVEVVWTVIPMLILITLAFYNQQVWSHIHGTPPTPELEVEITGEQFAWNIRYAGADGVFDTPDDVTTINQLHLPMDQVTLFHIKSKDVIHSFFVPQFRVKQDAVPGINGRLWVKPTAMGNYEIACAELCGLGHYRMRGFLTIESPEAFQQWLVQSSPIPPQPQT
jgi:cytochrome c oxidase subunit 2